MTTDRRPTGLQWLWGMGDWPEFEDYQRAGGGFGYEQWKREGKPPPPTGITPYAREILERTGGVPPGVAPERVGLPAVGERVEVERALRGVGKAEPTAPTELAAPTFPTAEPPTGYRWEYDSASMRYVLKPIPGAAPRTEWERERLEEQARKAEEEAAKEDEERRRQWEWREEEARREEEQRRQQQEWTEQEAMREQTWREQQLAAQQQQQQQMLGWYREQAQMQQEEAERQEMARLSAQPMSWLQYASYTGEQPAVQKWMEPLMPQQYQGLEAGGAIPGWTPEGGTAMPQLTTPSAQLYSRMGPTAQQQMAGYRQARTGIRPEEQEFRRRAQAPPGGRAGLRWTR